MNNITDATSSRRSLEAMISAFAIDGLSVLFAAIQKSSKRKR